MHTFYEYEILFFLHKHKNAVLNKRVFRNTPQKLLLGLRKVPVFRWIYYSGFWKKKYRILEYLFRANPDSGKNLPKHFLRFVDIYTELRRPGIKNIRINMLSQQQTDKTPHGVKHFQKVNGGF